MINFYFVILIFITGYFNTYEGNGECEIMFKNKLTKKSENQSVFQIESCNCEIETIEIRVLDRFGNLVFSSNKKDFHWNVGLLEDYKVGKNLVYF